MLSIVSLYYPAVRNPSHIHVEFDLQRNDPSATNEQESPARTLC